MAISNFCDRFVALETSSAVCRQVMQVIRTPLRGGGGPPPTRYIFKLFLDQIRCEIVIFSPKSNFFEFSKNQSQKIGKKKRLRRAAQPNGILFKNQPVFTAPLIMYQVGGGTPLLVQP